MPFFRERQLTRDPLNITIAEPENYPPEARAILENLGIVTEGPFDRRTLQASLENTDILVVRLGHLINAEIFDYAPRLKAIVSATTGLDHIDSQVASKLSVSVISLKGETEFLETIHATAELTWALLLAVLRNLPQATNSVRDGNWDRDKFRGQEACGKRLGILGLGRLGRMVAGYGKAFGMTVSAYDPYTYNWGDKIIRCPNIGALLKTSDVLSIHLPLNEETENMISTEELSLLPNGAIVINTARGAILDEAALAEAIRSGQIAGVGLDVLANENSEKSSNSPIVKIAKTHANVIITPHIGGAVVDAMEQSEIFMAQRLAKFLGAKVD